MGYTKLMAYHRETTLFVLSPEIQEDPQMKRPSFAIDSKCVTAVRVLFI